MIQHRLDYYTELRDVILPEIFEAIGEDGILQKDIYKFVETDKSEVQRILRELEFENKITREKKGNTYFITCNK